MARRSSSNTQNSGNDLQALSDIRASLLNIEKAFTRMKITTPSTSRNDPEVKAQSKSQKDLTNALTRSSKVVESSTDAMKKTMAQGVADIFKTVTSYTTQQMDRAFDKVASSFETHFSSVTSRLQMSARDYQNLFDNQTKLIKEKDLQFQFSVVDFTNQLEEVLGEGLRGDIASRKAMSDLISKKLVPGISTNTNEYRKMYQIYGDSFSGMVSSLETYNSRMQGFSLAEQGKADSLLSTLQPYLSYASGGNQEQLEQMSATMYSIGTYLENARMDSSTFTNLIESVMSGRPGEASLAADLLGIATPDMIFDKLTSESGMTELVTNYAKMMTGLLEGGNEDVANVLASEFGLELREVYAASGAFKAGKFDSNVMKSQLDSLIKGFDAQKENQENKDKLTQKYYQSVTDQMDKFNENSVEPLATKIVNNIPHYDETLGAMKDILSSMFSVMTTSGLFGGASSLVGAAGLGGLKGAGVGLGGAVAGALGGALLGGQLANLDPETRKLTEGRNALTESVKTLIARPAEKLLAKNESDARQVFINAANDDANQHAIERYNTLISMDPQFIGASGTDAQKAEYHKLYDSFGPRIESNPLLESARNQIASEYGSDFISRINPATYGFKTGIYKVGRDNLLASLHSGEMVLTSSDAEMLRSAANDNGTSVRGFLSQAEGQGSAVVVSAVVQSSKELTNGVTFAIESQTKSLISKIDEVISVILTLNSQAGEVTMEDHTYSYASN